MSQTTQSPLDAHRTRIEGWITDGHRSYRQVVRALAELGVSTSERSLRRALDRWGVPRPDTSSVTGPEKAGVKVEGDHATATSKPSFSYNTPDDLLLERGLDPEEWEVKSFTVNEWDSPTGDIMKQLKVSCRRRKPQYIVQPAEIDINLPKPKVRQHFDIPRMVVCVGDQQAPFQDERLHELFLEFLDYNRPDEGVLIGDTGDFNKISRHPNEPDHDVTTQECVNATGQLLYDYRSSSPDTLWKMLDGNHDERLRRTVINQLADYYGLRPAEIPTLPDHPVIHSPRHLYRLDELGIEYIDAQGSYEHAQVNLSPFLAARHGWLARKNSGATAHATLDHLGHSIIVGHTHRQSRVHQTKHTIDGRVVVNTAIETGCMCRIEGGLGYAVAPDWQNGFAVASIWPDGTFSADLATYVDGTLLYRDQRYS